MHLFIDKRIGYSCGMSMGRNLQVNSFVAQGNLPTYQMRGDSNLADD